MASGRITDEGKLLSLDSDVQKQRLDYFSFCAFLSHFITLLVLQAGEGGEDPSVGTKGI